MWWLVDGALAVLAVLLLAAVLLMLYRTVRAVMRRVGKLSSLVGDAAGGLAVLPPPATSGATVLTPSRQGGISLPQTGS